MYEKLVSFWESCLCLMSIYDLSVENEVFYCFLNSQVLQAVSNICQAIINQHSQMLLPCNLLTFPQKALVTESIWSHE